MYGWSLNWHCRATEQAPSQKSWMKSRSRPRQRIMWRKTMCTVSRKHGICSAAIGQVERFTMFWKMRSIRELMWARNSLCRFPVSIGFYALLWNSRYVLRTAMPPLWPRRNLNRHKWSSCCSMENTRPGTTQSTSIPWKARSTAATARNWWNIVYSRSLAPRLTADSQPQRWTVPASESRSLRNCWKRLSETHWQCR